MLCVAAQRTQSLPSWGCCCPLVLLGTAPHGSIPNTPGKAIQKYSSVIMGSSLIHVEKCQPFPAGVHSVVAHVPRCQSLVAVPAEPVLCVLCPFLQTGSAGMRGQGDILHVSIGSVHSQKSAQSRGSIKKINVER